MPTFSFRATDRQGKVVDGTMDVAEESAVVKKLHERGLIPIQISAGAFAGVSLKASLAPLLARVTASEVLNFTCELASMVKAGVPLDRSLRIILKNTNEKRALSGVLKQVLARVVEGSSLAEALAEHPVVFSRLYVSMVKSGEVSGSLDSVLERLAEFLELSQELRGYLLSAMIYPVLLSLVSLLSIAVLLVFVIPKFSAIFSDMGVPLPLPTAALLAVSGLMLDYWWFICAVAILSALGWRRYVKTPGGALLWDRVKLNTPVVGRLVQDVEFARFARTMGTMLKGGVHILQSLSIAQEGAGNRVIAGTIEELHGRVKKGEVIGGSLRSKPFVPPLAVEMISVGEETGRLQEIFLEMAETLDKQVRTRLKRLLALAEPVLIIVMGLIVGLIVVSMLLALFSVNEIPF